MVGAFELLSFVTRSPNRHDTLRALADAPHTRRDLETELGVPRATLNRVLADFRDRDLVVRDGRTYDTTPLGDVVASELAATLDALDGSLRLHEAQLPLDRFAFPLTAVLVADIITPSEADPLAPIRRAETLLADAAEVRIAATTIVPSCIEIVADRVAAGEQVCETIVTPDAVEVVAADPALASWSETLVAAPRAEVHVYDGDLPFALFVVDDTVFVVLTDGAGSIQGHVETDDPSVLSWANEALDAYLADSVPVDADLLTS